MPSLPDKFFYNCLSFLGILGIIIATGLSVAHGSQNVSLAWDADTSLIDGYRLYWGTSSGQYTQVVDVGNSTTGTLSGLAAAQTYYVVVTAYASNTESAPSAEISFTVPSQVPAVSVMNLVNGTALNSTGSLTLTASAAETGGTITKVEFYVGSTKIGETADAPYTVTWNNLPVGSYTITAVAYDADGWSTTSSQATVNVAAFKISSAQRLANGVVQLTIVGAAGRPNSIYVSSDLQNWTLLTTLVNTNGTLLFKDAGAASVSRRFYKIVTN